MSKWLLILCALLATARLVVFAAQDTSGKKVSQSDGRHNEKPQSRTEHGSQVVEAAPAAGQVRPSNSMQNNGGGQDDAETQRKLAEYTRQLVIVTAGLVVVGGLQAYILIRQEHILRGARNEIRSQVGWMKTQAEHMETQASEMHIQRELLGASVDISRDAAQAAQQSANASVSQIQMMRDKERARLVVSPPAEFPRPTAFPVVDDNDIELLPLTLMVEVFNEGLTKAFNVMMSGYLTTKQIEPRMELTFWGNDLIVPKVVGAFDAEHSLRVTIAPPDLMDFTWISSEDWKSIASGEEIPRVIGLLLYDDVFGNGHRTPFHFAWKITCDEDGPAEARWLDLSPAAT